jgi:hypothetical protein
MSADAVVLEQSLSDESSVPQFVEKQYLYVNDSNNSNYSSQIVIDTTSLSNSGSYLGWSESFLVMPLVLQMKTAAATVAPERPVDYVLALKSGYWNMIHSLSVELNNGSVVQQTPFVNVYSSFKCLTSWSDEDLKQHGKVCGFCPDTADSWLFNPTTPAAGGLAPNGLGLCNNRTSAALQITTAATNGAAITNIVPPTESVLSGANITPQYNKGLLCRLKWLNFSVTAGARNDNKMALLANNTVGLGQIFKSYVQSAAGSRAVVFPAIIRMKDVCDFFDKLPLLKGAAMRIYINTNQCYCQLRAANNTINALGVVGTAGNLALRSAPIILGGGGTNPLQVSSADEGQGFNTLVPNAGVAAALTDIEVAVSVVRTQFSQFGTGAGNVFAAPITSVRLYCPAYTMTPQAEAKYLSMMPTKKIVYEDFFQYAIPNIGNGQDFNVLVSNGLANLKSVVMMGHLPQASNGGDAITAVAPAGIYANSVASSTLLSPFSSTGGAPDPVAVSNFNIQLSGKNLFNQNKQYDYEVFVEQLQQSNQLNGGKTTGLASGLIGEEDFSNFYRYYYADCSRGLPGEEGVSRSIQIQGRNMSSVNVDYMVFACFSREIVLDLRSGARIE